MMLANLYIGIGFVINAIIIQLIKKQMAYYIWDKCLILGKALGNVNAIKETDPIDLMCNMAIVGESTAVYEMKIIKKYRIHVLLNILSGIVVCVMTGLGFLDVLVFIVPVLFVSCTLCTIYIITWSIGEYKKTQKDYSN